MRLRARTDRHLFVITQKQATPEPVATVSGTGTLATRLTFLIAWHR